MTAPHHPTTPIDTEGFHRLLFEQAGMAMLTADVKGRIIGWNAAAGRMFGAGAAETESRQRQRALPATRAAGHADDFASR